MKTIWISLFMASIFSSAKAQNPKMKTFSIGDTLVDVADFLETRIEEDTLVAFYSHSDFANARFSVITIKKDGKEIAGAGDETVKERAEKAGAKLNIEKNCIWYYTSSPSSQGSPGSLMHYWYVGMGGQAVIVSVFVDSDHKDTADARSVLDSIPLSVHSLRRK